MIALGIRYLTGYAVATDLSRQRAEWPPHPGRVFMAMAAAHFETGAEPSERPALEWIENAPPPALHASEASPRTITRAYVPVNDTAGDILGRTRQDRMLPRTRPSDDCVFLIWPEDPAAETRTALARICSKVTRIGHSSSVVQMWVAPSGSEPAPTWSPADPMHDIRLRVPAPGTLSALETAFNGSAIEDYFTLNDSLEAAPRGKEKNRLKAEFKSRFPNGCPQSRRPQITSWQGYARPSANQTRVVQTGPFDENFLILAKTEGPALGLESTLQLTGALRRKAMGPHPKSSPEWLSGHDPQGAPSLLPHVAFFPLPYVGFDYADGHILGLGMAIPRDIKPADGSGRSESLREALGPLFFDPDTGQERDLEIARDGVWKWTLQREDRERPPLTLQRPSWTRASRHWASVTPIVLHHYPKKREGELERIIREAFVSALFPQPDRIRVLSASAVPGAGHAMAVPAFTEGGENLCRYQTHAVVSFPDLVSGPMLVGRGRFRGYGLLRPLTDQEVERWQN